MMVMRYIAVEEVERLHGLVIQKSGGTSGLRDRGALEASVMQPMQTFDGEDLYPLTC